MAGGRQEARNREAGRRRDGTTHDPRTAEGPPQRPVNLLPILVYRQRHLSRGHFRRQNLEQLYYRRDTIANCCSLNRFAHF